MKRDDLIYGAHSGIQKAIRRGDLDLTKTCFDLMLSEKEHWNWLKWRANILVNEECWPLLGEFSTHTRGKEKPTPQEWQKFLYSLTLIKKSKDAHGLLIAVRDKLVPKKWIAHPEYDDFKHFLDSSEGYDAGPVPVIEAAYDSVLKSRRFSAYEKAALDTLRGRAYLGGMVGDRWGTLSSMILIKHRKLDPKMVQAEIAAGLQRYKEKGRGRPVTVPLPWYVFDMHTQIGKIVLSMVMKRQSDPLITKDKMDDIWFFMESGYTPKALMDTPVLIEKPKAFDSMWWGLIARERLRYGNQEPYQVENLWHTKIKSDIKRSVEWLLKKREED